jgi:hypothetical protein
VRHRLCLHQSAVAVDVVARLLVAPAPSRPVARTEATHALGQAAVALLTEGRCHHTADVAWFHTHRASGLKRGLLARLQAPFFSRSRSSAAGTNGGTIDPPLLPIEQTLGIKTIA